MHSLRSPFGSQHNLDRAFNRHGWVVFQRKLYISAILSYLDDDKKSTLTSSKKIVKRRLFQRLKNFWSHPWCIRWVAQRSRSIFQGSCLNLSSNLRWHLPLIIKSSSNILCWIKLILMFKVIRKVSFLLSQSWDFSWVLKLNLS